MDTLVCDPLDASVILSVHKENAFYVSSGALIAPNLVLTAAHSLDDADLIRVTNASYLLQNTKTGVLASSWRPHPLYRGESLQGVDLGIVKLAEPIQNCTYFKPTALSPEDLKHTTLERVGFGLRDGENQRNLIEEDSIKFFINKRYLQGYDENAYLGDSGGPVFFRKGTNAFLVGVHSGRKENIEGELENYSNTLTLTSDLIDWINRTAAELR